MIHHADTPRVSSWYSLDGPHRAIVLSSHVGLNRNITDVPFQHRLDDTGVLELRRIVDAAFYAIDEEFFVVDGGAIGEELRLFYEDRGVLVAGDRPGVSYVSPKRDRIVRLGVTDHLRISGFAGGFDLEGARHRATELDTLLEEQLEYAVSIKLGYLSPDIKRVGTGLTAHVLLHLPALEHSEGLKLPEEPSDERIVLNRYGGDEAGNGSLYSIACPAEFRESEEETIAALAGFAERLLHYEQEARHELVRRHGDELADTAGRALGTLRHARRIAADEAIDLVSVLRLGVSQALIDDVTLDDVSDLLFLCRDSSVKVLDTNTDADDIDLRRAELMRRLLGRTKDV